MKRYFLVFALCASVFAFISCKDSEVFVLQNIPFEAFFASEAEQFDALASPTQKAANGQLSYGSFHEKKEDVKQSTFEGITFPVKIKMSTLKKISSPEFTDESEVFEITTSIKGKDSTVRYSGKQNLFQSKKWSYYILDEEPKFYKEAFISNGSLSYSKIKGEKKNLGTLYIAKKENPKHTQGSEYVVYTDEGKTTLKFNDAEYSVDGSELNALNAVLVETSDGKIYGLTNLKNLFRGCEFGFSADSPLAGKTVKSLTFVTGKNVWYSDSFVLGESKKIDGKTIVKFNATAPVDFLL